ncbi:MAG: metal-dependent transcriptional regulator [Coriobacteriales bacterium]
MEQTMDEASQEKHIEEPVHLAPAHEDYIEALVIIEQSEHVDEVRSVDVAKLLGVSKASVSKALTVLRDAGLVEQRRYGRVHLTPAGTAYGMQVWGRHQTLRRFLIDDLGVAPEVANEEACRMEHVVSQDTIDKLSAFLRGEHGGSEGDETSEEARREALEGGVTVKFEK